MNIKHISISPRARAIKETWDKEAVLPAYCWQTLEEELLVLGVPQYAIDTQKAYDISNQQTSENTRECGFRY